MQARYDAILNGRVNLDGTACFWIGWGDDQARLIWPAGYYAADSPLRVLDEKGRVRATAGRQVALSGGLGPDEIVGKPLVGCPQPGQVWVVGTVLSGK